MSRTTEDASGPYRLAIVHSHPIEYLGPFFARLTRHPKIDLTVLYGSRMGVAPSYDPDFQVHYQWDRPLLDGYRHRFLKNVWPGREGANSFWRVFNPELLTVLSRRRFDAVLIYGWSMASFWLAFAACAVKRIPYLITGDTILPKEQTARPRSAKSALAGLVLRRAGAALNMGQASDEFMRSHGVHPDDSFLVPYSPDVEYLQQEAARLRAERDCLRSRYGIAPDDCVFLYAGKLIERKGVQDLLAAFGDCARRALRSPPDLGRGLAPDLVGGRGAGGEVWLLIVGDGPLRGTLEQKVREQGIPHVVFLGFQNQSELPAFYSLADAFILPSLREPWGVVVNEAFACGLPVIAADTVGATRDARFFQDGRNGFVYPAGDVGQLSERLLALAGDRDLRERMGQAARETVGWWNYDLCVENTVKAVAHALSRRRSAG
ncbi:MAG: glycosyltransferase family 4 protein [Chloroflexi bacterium]|nr:glycosyltransferase family 4 protein [Chloroflexota bacterium]